MDKMSTYTVSEFAKLVGVSVKTLQRWDREGKLKAGRTPSNRRIYTDDDLAQFFQLQKPKGEKKTVVYIRVSHAAFKEELLRQQKLLEQFCSASGYTVDQWIVEIGKSLDFNRPKLLKIVDSILIGRTERLIIGHEDRLARFGNDLIEHICQRYGCELVIMNAESLSPSQELAEDFLTITDTFARRLSDLQPYQPQLQEALQNGQTKKQTDLTLENVP